MSIGVWVLIIALVLVLLVYLRAARHINRPEGGTVWSWLAEEGSRGLDEFRPDIDPADADGFDDGAPAWVDNGDGTGFAQHPYPPNYPEG